MTISFKCPNCSAALNAPDEYAGGSARCQICRTPVRIPRSGDSKSASVSSPPAADPTDHPTTKAAAFNKLMACIIVGMIVVAGGIVGGIVISKRRAATPLASTLSEGTTVAESGNSSVDYGRHPAMASGEDIREKPSPQGALFPIWGWENQLFGIMDQRGTVLVQPRFSTHPTFSEGLAAITQDGKFGYVDGTGEWAIPPRFDFDPSFGICYNRAIFSEGMAIVKSGELCSYIDREGTVVISGTFHYAEPFSDGLAFVHWADGKGLHYAFIDNKGDVAIELPDKMAPARPLLDEPRDWLAAGFSEGLAPVVANDAHGYIDKQGNIAIPLQFMFAHRFSEGLAAVNVNKREGYINKQGKIVIEPVFGLAREFHEGLAPVFIEESWGYIDTAGQRVIPPQFQDVGPFVEGLAAVKSDRRWGFVDHAGKLVIPTIAKEVSDFRGGIALFKPYGYVDRSGRFIWMTPAYRHLAPTTAHKLAESIARNKTESFSVQPAEHPVESRGKTVAGDTSRAVAPPDALFAIWEEELFGVMDHTGDVLISPRFRTYPAFSQGLAPIAKGTQFGYIDRSGKWVISPRFSTDDPAWEQNAYFSEGLAAVKLGRSYGFIDRTGKVAIDGRFFRAEPFSEGLAYVWLAGSEGLSFCFIDKTGKVVIELPETFTARPSYVHEPVNRLVAGYSEGMVAVMSPDAKNYLYGYMDHAGTIAIAPQFEEAERFTEGLAAVKVNKQYGYINRLGDVIIKPSFDGAGLFQEGVAPVRVGDSYGFVNTSGRLVISPRFQEAASFVDGLAAVKIDGQWGFADHDGKLVIPAIAKTVTSFRNGVALYLPYGYVDRSGRFVWMSPARRHLGPTTAQKLAGEMADW